MKFQALTWIQKHHKVVDLISTTMTFGGLLFTVFVIETTTGAKTELATHADRANAYSHHRSLTQSLGDAEERLVGTYALMSDVAKTVAPQRYGPKPGNRHTIEATLPVEYIGLKDIQLDHERNAAIITQGLSRQTRSADLVRKADEIVDRFQWLIAATESLAEQYQAKRQGLHFLNDGKEISNAEFEQLNMIVESYSASHETLLAGHSVLKRDANDVSNEVARAANTRITAVRNWSRTTKFAAVTLTVIAAFMALFNKYCAASEAKEPASEMPAKRNQSNGAVLSPTVGRNRNRFRRLPIR